MRTTRRLAALLAALSLSGCAAVARTVYAPPTRCAALCDTYFHPMSLAADDGHGSCRCYAPIASGDHESRATSATIRVESRPLVASVERAR